MGDVESTKTVVEPVAPIRVAVIGTGTGDGGTPIPSTGMLAKTADHFPDVVVQVISPVVAIAIRFANAYVTTMLGLLTAGMTTNAIPYTDFKNLVVKCAALSLAGPCVSLLKDIVTILGDLEKRHPLATGNV